MKALDDALDELAEQLARGEGPSVVLDATHLLHEMSAAYQRLAEIRTAAARQARDAYGWSYAEIAETLGITRTRAAQICNSRS